MAVCDLMSQLGLYRLHKFIEGLKLPGIAGFLAYQLS